MITPERMEQLKAVFQVACDLDTTERDAYLDDACRGDSEMRAELEKMLAADRRNEAEPLRSPFGENVGGPAEESSSEDSKLLEVHKDLLSSYKGECYQIRRVIGEGGGGRVYLAWDTHLEREVAVKFLSNDSIPDKRKVERFKREARAPASITHKNIVVVYELVTSFTIPFIITEYVEGESLLDRLKRGNLSVLDALAIAIEVAAALGAAHEKGVVHRDIKPANIMVGRNDNIQVKVLDFGIAKRTQVVPVDLEAATKNPLTTPGMIIGTAHYMSPEQIRGQGVNPRTDIWSLGVVLYEMLTGIAPFQGEGWWVLGKAICEETPKPLQELVTDLPGGLQEIVDKALAKERKQRYEKASQLQVELEKLRDSITSGRGESTGHSSLPEPDAPLKEPGPPGSMRAFRVVAGAEQESIPFDLGAVWGLARSSFVGILAGGTRDGAYEGLLRAERGLADAIKAGGDAKVLPARWWLTVNPGRRPNGPSSVGEVWESLSDESDPRVRYLRGNGLPATVIPGLFFEVAASDPNGRQMGMIQNWCRELNLGEMVLPQLAIVLHMSGTNADESRQAASRLPNELKVVSGQMPIEVMAIDGAPGDVEERLRPGAVGEMTEGGENDDDWVVESGSEQPQGLHFCLWVSAASEAFGRRLRDPEEQKKYRAVLTQFKMCPVRTSAKGYKNRGEAGQVVKDLEAFAEVGEEFCREFLTLVEQYLPDAVRPLVMACAASRKREVRRSSLVYAARDETGSLLDTWVEGNRLKPERAPEGPDLFPTEEDKPLVEELVLALLRWRRKGGDHTGRVEEFVRRQKPRLREDFWEVVALCLKDISPETFAENFRYRKYLLALRAGENVEFLVERLSPTSIEEPDLWWLLAALPPSSHRVGNLLKSPPGCRAVMGLCTPSEWQQVSNDLRIKSLVLDCRRKRPIEFLHS